MKTYEQLQDIALEWGKDMMELFAELEKHRWIPISERLPEDSRIVLIACDDGNIQWVETLFYNLGTWTPNGDSTKDITHWKPIILPDQALKRE